MASVAALPADTGARQKRHMDHEKERKELFSKHAAQVYYYSHTVNILVSKAVWKNQIVWLQIRLIIKLWGCVCVSQSFEKKVEISEAEGQIEGQCDTTDSQTKQAQASSEGGGAGVEGPFIKLGQEEYGEHHSSIMHCRWVEIQTL